MGLRKEIYMGMLMEHIVLVRYGVLAVIILIAIADDYRRYKISNRIIISGLVLSVLMCVIEMYMVFMVGDGHTDIMYGEHKSCKDIGIMYASGMLLGLAGGYILYCLRGIGAGDVKLFAVAGMFIGGSDIGYLIGVSLAAGIVTGVAENIRKRELVAVTGKCMHRFHFTYAILAGVCIMVCFKLSGVFL